MSEKENKHSPRFRTEGKPPKVRLFLQCSACEKDIREMKPKEKIDVRRGYYCADCDNGTIVLNPPIQPSK